MEFGIEECEKGGVEVDGWVVCIGMGKKGEVRVLGKKCVVKKEGGVWKELNGRW